MPSKSLLTLKITWSIRWFAGAAKGDSQMQTKMIVSVTDGVLRENAKRAKAKKVRLNLVVGFLTKITLLFAHRPRWFSRSCAPRSRGS